MKTKCEQLFLIENVKHVADVGVVGDVERVGQLVKLPAKWRPTVAHAQTCTDMCALVPSVYRERERERREMYAMPNGALCLGKTVENLCKAARHLRAILTEAAGRTHLGRKCDNPERREIEQKIEATTAADAAAAVAERVVGQREELGVWGNVGEVGHD